MNFLHDLRQRGYHCNAMWLEKAIDYMKMEKCWPPSIAEQKQCIIDLYLDCDLRESCDLSEIIIRNFDHLSRFHSEVPVVLQIENIINVAQPFEKREDKGSRLLKLLLSDGISYIPALELRPIDGLLVDSPIGSKLLLKNCLVRRGCLMLDNSCAIFLHGEINLQSRHPIRSISNTVDQHQPDGATSRSSLMSDMVPRDNVPSPSENLSVFDSSRTNFPFSDDVVDISSIHEDPTSSFLYENLDEEVDVEHNFFSPSNASATRGNDRNSNNYSSSISNSSHVNDKYDSSISAIGQKNALPSHDSKPMATMKSEYPLPLSSNQEKNAISLMNGDTNNYSLSDPNIGRNGISMNSIRINSNNHSSNNHNSNNNSAVINSLGMNNRSNSTNKNCNQYQRDTLDIIDVSDGEGFDVSPQLLLPRASLKSNWKSDDERQKESQAINNDRWDSSIPAYVLKNSLYSSDSNPMAMTTMIARKDKNANSIRNEDTDNWAHSNPNIGRSTNSSSNSNSSSINNSYHISIDNNSINKGTYSSSSNNSSTNSSSNNSSSSNSIITSCNEHTNNENKSNGFEYGIPSKDKVGSYSCNGSKELMSFQQLFSLSRSSSRKAPVQGWVHVLPTGVRQFKVEKNMEDPCSNFEFQVSLILTDGTSEITASLPSILVEDFLSETAKQYNTIIQSLKKSDRKEKKNQSVKRFIHFSGIFCFEMQTVSKGDSDSLSDALEDIQWKIISEIYHEWNPLKMENSCRVVTEIIQHHLAKIRTIAA